MYPYKTPVSTMQATLPDNTSGDPIMDTSKLRQYNPAQSPAGFAVISRSLELLRPYLPECLPLYRRIQSGRFFDDTAIFTNIDCQNEAAPRTHWLLAFVDRSCRPETEVWLFGSWEATPPAESDDEAWQSIRGMVRELLEVVKRLAVPVSIHAGEAECVGVASGVGNGSLKLQSIASSDTVSSDEKDSAGYSRNDYAGHASNPDIMLWGAVHERTVPILQEIGVLSTAYKTGLVPNSTFIFKLDDLPSTPPLPKGLKWSNVDPRDFALVRSRTQIPRQERTMAILPSLAIRPISRSTSGASETLIKPVAWAFVGLDGSLTTLHVEPEWRGRGLAKAIAAKLFKEQMHSFWEAGTEKMSHGYVVNGNAASEATCRSLGGSCGWQSYWLRVDLQKV